MLTNDDDGPISEADYRAEMERLLARLRPVDGRPGYHEPVVADGRTIKFRIVERIVVEVSASAWLTDREAVKAAKARLGGQGIAAGEFSVVTRRATVDCIVHEVWAAVPVLDLRRAFIDNVPDDGMSRRNTLRQVSGMCPPEQDRDESPEPSDAERMWTLSGKVRDATATLRACDGQERVSLGDIADALEAACAEAERVV